MKKLQYLVHFEWNLSIENFLSNEVFLRELNDFKIQFTKSKWTIFVIVKKS